MPLLEQPMTTNKAMTARMTAGLIDLRRLETPRRDFGRVGTLGSFIDMDPPPVSVDDASWAGQGPPARASAGATVDDDTFDRANSR